MSKTHLSESVRVYILGAGASKEDGAPLMSELLERSFWNFGGKSTDGVNLMGIVDEELDLKPFREVFRLAHHFYPNLHLEEKMEELYRTKNQPDLPQMDIEDFFTRIDNMLKGKEDYGIHLDKQKLLQIRKDAGFFFYHTLSLETGLTRILDRGLPRHYLAFVENVLAPGIRHCVISFNYDLLLESAMSSPSHDYKNQLFNRRRYSAKHLPWTYAVPFENVNWQSSPYQVEGENLAMIHYLKLHGSLNWGICPSTGKLTMHPAHSNAWIHKRFYKGHYRCNNGKELSEPLLIPPVRQKDLSIPGLKRVWEKASTYLSEAEELHILGYSLPDADTGARELLEDNIPSRLQKLVIANPNKAHREKFKTLYGTKVSTFEYKSFSEYVSQSVHSV